MVLAAMQDASDHCEQLVREADKDRYLAALFAPADRRAALHALYAFNIEVARVPEAAREPLPGEVRLQWWREVLAGERPEDAAAHPVAAALSEALKRHAITVDPLAALIDARAFDLYGEAMANLAALEAYADKTSSALITLTAQVLSVADAPAARAIAAHAGRAYAISNLLKALPLHAGRRRLYLPLDLLERHGVRPDDIFAGHATPALHAALAELRTLARRHLTQLAGMLDAMPQALLPALLPVAPMPLLLSRMERRGYDPFVPVEVPQWRRQWLMWRAARNVQRIAR
jgi:15-cis-phytoene synthase